MIIELNIRTYQSPLARSIFNIYNFRRTTFFELIILYIYIHLYKFANAKNTSEITTDYRKIVQQIWLSHKELWLCQVDQFSKASLNCYD